MPLKGKCPPVVAGSLWQGLRPLGGCPLNRTSPLAAGSPTTDGMAMTAFILLGGIPDSSDSASSPALTSRVVQTLRLPGSSALQAELPESFRTKLQQHLPLGISWHLARYGWG
jgi:hypothetical protein